MSEATDIPTGANGTADQTITTAQPVTVTPVTSQSVTTQTSGAASIETLPATLGAVAERALVTMPWAVVVGIGAIGLYLMALMSLCLWLWLQDNNPRAGEIVLGVGALVTPLLTFLFGLYSHPPTLAPRASTTADKSK